MLKLMPQERFNELWDTEHTPACEDGLKLAHAFLDACGETVDERNEAEFDSVQFSFSKAWNIYMRHRLSLHKVLEAPDRSSVRNGMELYDLTVCVVGVDGSDGSSTQHFRLLAKAFTGSGILYSRLLDADAYRAAMQNTNLTIDQIEAPIRTGTHTMFAGRGGGDKAFQRVVLEDMGMRSELI